MFDSFSYDAMFSPNFQHVCNVYVRTQCMYLRSLCGDKISSKEINHKQYNIKIMKKKETYRSAERKERRKKRPEAWNTFTEVQLAGM